MKNKIDLLRSLLSITIIVWRAHFRVQSESFLEFLHCNRLIIFKDWFCVFNLYWMILYIFHKLFSLLTGLRGTHRFSYSKIVIAEILMLISCHDFLDSNLSCRLIFSSFILHLGFILLLFSLEKLNLIHVFLINDRLKSHIVLIMRYVWFWGIYRCSLLHISLNYINITPSVFEILH